jgi:1-acyl-sn-glycerol-3-phosphate acyltransferase
MRKHIDKWSIWYWFWKHIVRVSFMNYYSRIEVRNVKKIPHRKPVIFVLNHQNALMDALAVLTTNRYQPVFLARGDIFKKRIVIAILTFLKILPIYRIRDGAEQVKKNEAIFEQTLHVLKNRINPLGLMPEGNHGDKRRLRPLMKGVFRIAFKAQEDYGRQPGVKIQPVGLDYEHYQKFGKSLFVNYGEPIEVSDFYEHYEHNQGQAMNDFRLFLAGKMKEVMIHIETKKYYDLYQNLRTIYNPVMRKYLGFKKASLAAKFDADKKMIEILDNHQEKLEQPNEDMRAYVNGLKKLNFRDWLFRKKKHSYVAMLFQTLFLIIAFPVYVLGLINNYLPFKLPQLSTKKIKDKQFHSSFKYVIGLILFTVYYLILTLLALVFIRPFWLALLYIALIYPSGKFAFFYFKQFKKTLAKWRYNMLSTRKKDTMRNMHNLRNRIIETIDNVVQTELAKHKTANNSLSSKPFNAKAS